MSPFARFLKTKRQSRAIRQNQLAGLLGYEPSYLSALERCAKGPPRREFIERLIRGLTLSDEEQHELQQAIKGSRRQFFLPANAHEQEYALMHLLEPQLGKLHPLQVQLITLILAIPEAFTTASSARQSSTERSMTQQEVSRM